MTPPSTAAPPVRTTCPYCGVGCGLLVERPGAEAGVAVRGDPEHPANLGRLCSKGAALGDTVGLEGRLLHPEIGGRRVAWAEALDAVAGGFRQALRDHGPDSVALYISGQLLTEDYYAANKLMKGFLGSANVDTNSRLCMASAVAGHKRAFGSDTVPGCYEDLELADLVVLAGSNTAWCHPVLYQRIAAAKERRPALKVVVVDPRRTATCALADLHLAVTPGSDAVLFNGLLAHLQRGGHMDAAFVARHTSGLDAALAAATAAAGSAEAVSQRCGLPVDAVARFYRWFAETERSVTAFSQGINQSTSGADKVNAILNCHLATGRIGRPGMGPFSLTGQPNAMGGREVGGLANQLAAHLELGNPAHRDLAARFWRAPRMTGRPGLLAVDLFRAVEAGQIRALWIMATNPAVSLPDADRVRRAIAACPFVVVSDCERATDTAALAHVLLPAAAWGEKDGTVTNSERRISRQRAFLPVPGEARPDWWCVTEVARRLGFAEAFPYRGPADIFREHAALSAFENGGTRDFDLGAFAGMTDAEYERFEPVQWPVTDAAPRGTARLFGAGGFFHADGRARFVAVQPRPPAAPPDRERPFVLNTGRVRDQWHTMTRTGRAARLTSHAPEPTATLHPQDARRAGIAAGTLVRLSSALGEMIARAALDDGQAPGSVFAPIHWSGSNARAGRVGALIPSRVDPVSGQPEFKHARVAVQPLAAAWHGFLLAANPQPVAEALYQVRVRGAGHWRIELAGAAPCGDWPAWARRAAGEAQPGDAWIEFVDRASSRYRGACVRGGRLHFCCFVAADPALPDRTWLGELFAKAALTEADRTALLTGSPGARGLAGAAVCSCFGVGAERIAAAIRERGLRTCREVGAVLQAGTNCGSCLPEIQALLAAAAPAGAATKAG